MSKNISKKRLAELFRLALITHQDLSRVDLSIKLVELCEANNMRPVTRYPSECLHSMREACTCRDEYNTEWGKDA